MVRAVQWCCRMQKPQLLMLLFTLLPQDLCLGGPSGQQAEGKLVPATRISCRPAADFPEGVNMGNRSGRMLLKKLPDGQTVLYVHVDSNQSYTPHDDLGTVLLKVTPGNELRIDLYLVYCPCADNEECPQRPDPAKIKFVCDYAFGPKGPTVIPDSFEKPANVSDVELPPAVCCKDEQCPEGSAANSSAIYKNRRPSDNGNDSGKESLYVVIGVLLTFLVVALFAIAYLFRKNRQLQGLRPETIASRGGKDESHLMDPSSA